MEAVTYSKLTDFFRKTRGEFMVDALLNIDTVG
jgi:hypothetical protein